MGLTDFIIPPWVKPVVIAVAVVTYTGFVWYKGDKHGTEKYTKYVAEEATATTKLAAARVQVVHTVETKWRTRTETITKQGEKIYVKVPEYVTKVDDAGCIVNSGFVRVYDAAIANNPDPGPSIESDRTPSGIPLSVISTTDAFNITLGLRWKARAEECIETYNAVKNAR